jgi:hypothetical protein
MHLSLFKKQEAQITNNNNNNIYANAWYYRRAGCGMWTSGRFV